MQVNLQTFLQSTLFSFCDSMPEPVFLVQRHQQYDHIPRNTPISLVSAFVYRLLPRHVDVAKPCVRDQSCFLCNTYYRGTEVYTYAACGFSLVVKDSHLSSRYEPSSRSSSVPINDVDRNVSRRCPSHWSSSRSAATYLR
jgi:hypothetical protein